MSAEIRMKGDIKYRRQVKMHVPFLLMFYWNSLHSMHSHTVPIKYALKDIEMFLNWPSISAHDLLGPDEHLILSILL